MKRKLFVACAVLALGTVAFAEEYQLLKAKAGLLVDQAEELYADSCRKGSEIHGPQYRYYFGLMSACGTNLLARAKSTLTERRLTQYCELIGKDYDAYTKVEANTVLAAATGGTRRNRSDARHRAKRLINAEKLGDKELAAAVGRWEKFVKDLQKDPK